MLQHCIDSEAQYDCITIALTSMPTVQMMTTILANNAWTMKLSKTLV